MQDIIGESLVHLIIFSNLWNLFSASVTQLSSLLLYKLLIVVPFIVLFLFDPGSMSGITTA
jgi:hypothetical protein